MAHVPTEAEIDAMSEDELQAYLAGGSGEADDPASAAAALRCRARLRCRRPRLRPGWNARLRLRRPVGAVRS